MKHLVLGMMVALGLTGAANAATFTLYNNSATVIDVQWKSKNSVDVTSSAGKTERYFPGQRTEGLGVPVGVTLTVESTVDTDVDIWVTPTWTQYGSTYYKVDKDNDWKITYTGTAFQLWKQEENTYKGPIPATDLTPAKKIPTPFVYDDLPIFNY